MTQLVVDDTFPCMEKLSELALESYGVGNGNPFWRAAENFEDAKKSVMLSDPV